MRGARAVSYTHLDVYKRQAPAFVAPTVVAPVVAAPAPVATVAPAPAAVAVAGAQSIVSPMPGVVFKIRVAVGQQVAKEEELIVLEAMKMESPCLLYTSRFV